MQRYTPQQIHRALGQEQLLKRVEQGEDFDDLCQELGLSLSRNYLPELRCRYRQGGSSWEALIDHRHGHPYKVTLERRAWLREQKLNNSALTQQELVVLFGEAFQESISQSHISNILRAEGVAIPGGQRYHPQEEQPLPLERAGVFFPPSRGPANGRAEGGDPGDSGEESRLPGA